jgi:aspartate aminotransferase
MEVNTRLKSLGQSSTLRIQEVYRELSQAGGDLINLGLGQSPFPVPSSIQRALASEVHRKDYLSTSGLKELRHLIARFHQSREGVSLCEDRVIIGPGSKEIIFLTQLCHSGPLVLNTPCWVTYEPQAKILDKKILKIHTHQENNWKIDPKDLDNSLSLASEGSVPALLILNYPNNPHGGGYSASELEELARVCARHKAIVLSDEIYAETNFEGSHTSISRFYPEGTIMTSGLSKWCGAGGWRLGYGIFPSRLKDLYRAVCAVASETFSSVCAPVQYAALRAFEDSGELERYRQDTRRILAALSDQCFQILKGAGLRVSPAVGSFYLFPGFCEHQSQLESLGLSSGREICEYLLNKKLVASLPGEEFGRDGAELNLRISLVDFDGETVLDTIAKEDHQWIPDLNWLESHCPRVLEGCRRIASLLS